MLARERRRMSHNRYGSKKDKNKGGRKEKFLFLNVCLLASLLASLFFPGSREKERIGKTARGEWPEEALIGGRERNSAIVFLRVFC